VWQHCDGHRSVAKIAKLLGAKFETEIEDEVVWVALEDL